VIGAHRHDDDAQHHVRDGAHEPPRGEFLAGMLDFFAAHRLLGLENSEMEHRSLLEIFDRQPGSPARKVAA